MAWIEPFRRHGGLTVALSVTNSSHAAVQVLTLGPSGETVQNYLIYNSGTDDVFMNIGSNSGIDAAVIPSDGTPANGIPLPKGTVQLFSGPSNAWFTMIGSQAGPAVVFITPGVGV